MTLWAIVPVKPLRRGKSRLAGVLSPEERTDLNRRLLVHTLDTLTVMPEFEQVLVVSRDQSALALARNHGARTVQESGAPKLNMALACATFVAKKYATHGVLIIPADLPLISQEDVRSMLSACPGSAGSRHSTGPTARRHERPAGLPDWSDRLRVWTRLL